MQLCLASHENMSGLHFTPTAKINYRKTTEIFLHLLNFFTMQIGGSLNVTLSVAAFPLKFCAKRKCYFLNFIKNYCEITAQ